MQKTKSRQETTDVEEQEIPTEVNEKSQEVQEDTDAFLDELDKSLEEDEVVEETQTEGRCACDKALSECQWQWR